jgi:hypothetical protein
VPNFGCQGGLGRSKKSKCAKTPRVVRAPLENSQALTKEDQSFAVKKL